MKIYTNENIFGLNFNRYSYDCLEFGDLWDGKRLEKL